MTNNNNNKSRFSSDLVFFLFLDEKKKRQKTHRQQHKKSFPFEFLGWGSMYIEFYVLHIRWVPPPVSQHIASHNLSVEKRYHCKSPHSPRPRGKMAMGVERILGFISFYLILKYYFSHHGALFAGRPLFRELWVFWMRRCVGVDSLSWKMNFKLFYKKFKFIAFFLADTNKAGSVEKTCLSIQMFKLNHRNDTRYQKGTHDDLVNAIVMTTTISATVTATRYP
jgi:hypothetical protein